jgi:hypothetical protein
MKRKLLLALLVLLVAVAVPGSALAAGHEDGRVVWGGTYTLDEGETLYGDLVARSTVLWSPSAARSASARVRCCTVT